MSIRRFLRTPKGGLLMVFLGLFGIGVTAVGWSVAVPHMLAAVLGRIDRVTAAELLRTPFVQATLFLALFMLTDPPTAPSRYADQVGIGVLVAAASIVAKVLGAGQVYLLVGLLAGNIALVARRWQRSAAGPRTQAVATVSETMPAV
jgi:Na+-translocating ferredoxin:NAD+ oxidoreductase RnfD subunit